MQFAQNPRLANDAVILEPLSHQWTRDLQEAVASQELWRHWFVALPTPEGMAEEIDRRLAEHADGLCAPWAIISAATGRAVGMTAFHTLDHANRRLEIGRTWMAAHVHGTGINPSVKYLQLERAFETLGVNAVEFRTNWHNHRSRAAIERLGAKQDGVLRKHRIHPDGTVRDTVIYSITNDEWPAVKLTLMERLQRRLQVPTIPNEASLFDAS
ncbi:N-acetyltransferase GCN5 [Corynebacterium suranareeae]|uniref:N-acetyltransferase GCN5 n=1 Tax=Corynebacterium suranareeae TaxID=2506452 RepID=A0A160PP20_9CORY|nr:GNAT family protein [Corynebacterium suranareeae]BAU95639.1 N-acetyltransferase GCN5 [Corynebacterium suranareeae]